MRFGVENPDGTITGKAEGEGGQANVPLAPYTDRYADYQRTANDSLETLSIPASLKDLIRTYFTELEP